MISARILGGLTVGLAMTTAAGASDWGFVRGPHGDGTAADAISTTWPAGGPKVVWKTASFNGFSTLTVGGGEAFCQELRDVDGASREVLVARDAATGKELWVKPLGPIKVGDGGQSGTPNNGGGDGPRSTPTVSGGKVYVNSARLVVSCFDAKTGDLVWSHDLVKEFHGKVPQWENAASPLVEGGLVLAGGGGPGESLVAFKAGDGAVAWKAFDEVITHSTPTPATILGQRQAIFFLHSGLLAVNPSTGAELWRYTFPFRVSTAASPVVVGDLVYCSAGYGVGAGACRIAKDGDKFTATEVYRKTGDKPLANHWSTPVVKDGMLYGLFQFKEYGSGPLKCVNAATGEVKWEKPGFGPGQVILAGDHVLVLSDAGDLVLVKATPESYEEVARAHILDGKCWGSPVVANGRVYARSTTQAVCVDLSAGASR